MHELGREVLSFIPGIVPWPEEFGLLGPRDRLARVARLIREFHDAVTGFVPPADAHWQVLIPSEYPDHEEIDEANEHDRRE